MTLLAHRPLRATELSDNARMKQQLIREIACLERQLERVRGHLETSGNLSLKTYDHMIRTRRELLYSLA